MDLREVGRGFEHSMAFASWTIILSVTYLDQEWISLEILFAPLIFFLSSYTLNRWMEYGRELSEAEFLHLRGVLE